MLKHATTAELTIKPGKPPAATIGYLAPSVGSFTLRGAKSGKDATGEGAFVWYHGCHLVVDWHPEKLKFAGIATDDQKTKFWVYDVVDENHDVEDCAADHGHEGMRIFFAQARTNSGTPKGVDEGFRIFYSLHGHLHLWAWDARTFGGHTHMH